MAAGCNKAGGMVQDWLFNLLLHYTWAMWVLIQK